MKTFSKHIINKAKLTGLFFNIVIHVVVFLLKVKIGCYGNSQSS